jgi:transcriptional regulator with XRE-family HTH domain
VKAQENLTVGQRIWQIAEEQRFSKIAFATALDVTRQTLDNWINGKGSPDSARLEVASKMLGVSLTDLLGITKPTGKGNDLVPFYDAITVGGNDLLADQDPIRLPARMINPGTFFRNAEGALQITGHSMFPKYPAGCVVAYKTASVTLIIWGEDYVIELSDRRILKRIEKGDVKGHIKAVSYNVNKDQKYVYDPIDIPLTEIKRMFMVLGKIELEAMQL